MRRTKSAKLFAAFVTASLVAASPAAAVQSGRDSGPEPGGRHGFAPPPARGEVLVKFRKGVSRAEADALIGEKGGTRKGEITRLGIHAVTFPAGDPRGLAADLMRSPKVEYAEPNAVVQALATTPNDPYYSSSGSYGQVGRDMWGLQAIRIGDAWDVQRGSADVLVAVTDTGVDPTHPEMLGKIWNNPGETGFDGAGQDRRCNGIDDDANGYVDDWRGWDFVGPSYATPAPDNDPSDPVGHGSHVAGTIAAATDNGAGVAGVSWHSKILVVKLLDNNGYGNFFDGLSAIVYAADLGAKVINCSWGAYLTSAAVEDAVNYAVGKGAVVVAAAGNDAVDASGMAPGNAANVVTVGASNQADQPAEWSNFGPAVEVVAPGEEILSIAPLYQNQFIPGYAMNSGTSMAAPHVAGVAALLFAQHPDWSPLQVMAQLSSTADRLTSDLTGFWPSETVFDRLDAWRALTEAGAPAVRIAPSLAEVAGNGDGRVDPGETMALTAVVKNVGHPLAGAVVTLSAQDPHVTVLGGMFTPGDLATYAAADNAAQPFTFAIAPDTPRGSRVAVTLTVSGNAGAWSQGLVLEYTVHDVAPPTAPRNVTATSDTYNGRVGVSWRPATDDVGVAYYRVYTGTTPDLGEVWDWIYDTYAWVCGDVGSTYYFAVSAVDEAGNEGPRSPIVSALSVDRSAPGTPPAPAVAALPGPPPLMQVTWDIFHYTDECGYGFNVYRSTKANGGYVKLNAAPISEWYGPGPWGYDDFSAPTDKKLYYVITAVDGAGNESRFSSVASGVIDTLAPTAPARLTVTASGSTAARLAWTAATDNVGVKEYRVERSPDGAGWAEVGTSTTTRFTEGGLLPGTACFYRVRATDAAGNLGAYSSTAGIVMP